MIRVVAAVLLLVLVGPIAAAHVPGPCDPPEHVTAVAGNQRVDVRWEPTAQVCQGTDRRPVVGYLVSVYRGGEILSNQTTETTQACFLLTNGQPYAFLVYARDDQGNLGPPSAPVSATPVLDRDLQYLSAGLIVTWLAVFGYAAFLSRREARLDRKLEQLLSHREGRNP